MSDVPPLAPSIWAAVELAGADFSLPIAYGPPRRLPTTRQPDHSGVT
jgi:hypothetical protein